MDHSQHCIIAYHYILVCNNNNKTSNTEGKNL